MKFVRTVVFFGVISSCLSLPQGTPTDPDPVDQIPSAIPTLDPSWRHNRTRQHKHVHDFFKLFGWLRRNDTIKEDDIPAAIRKIQRVLKEPETGEYDERMEVVMSRPRCGTIPPFNPADADISPRSDHVHKRYVLWGPKWNRQTITYRFVNYTSDIGSDRQRATLSTAFANWNQYLPISIVPAPSTVSRADIHVRFMNMGAAEPAYGFTNMIAEGLTMASGLINITFNDDYNWSDDRLFNFTAVHEIGHALGLSHSKVEDSIMFPYYEGIIRPMHPDDKAAVHSLYGWKDPRWNRIDNSGTKFIHQLSSTSNTPSALEGLYQLRSTGQVLFYTPAGSWTSVDNNKDTVQITGAGSMLYQRHTDGSVYKYTGSNSAWNYIGAASDNIIEIVAAADEIYQRRKDGWIARWTGTGTTWSTIGQARPSKQIAITDTKTLWNLLTTGDLVRSEYPYNTGWTVVDQNPLNIAIATGGNEFYKLQSDGKIVWLDSVGYYWVTIGEGRNVASIYAAGTYLYKREGDRSIWRYTGTPGVWEMLDGAGVAVDVVGDRRGGVWELRGSGEVMRLVS